MIKRKDELDADKRFEGPFSESTEKLNKIMEKLRARLYTLAETALVTEQQSTSFKRAVKDYTSEAWNEINEIVKELETK